MQPSQIYAQNNDLANYGQQNAGVQQGAYNGYQGQTSQAIGNLQSYQQNMPDLGRAYGQNLQSAEQQTGFNPEALKNAQQALAATQTTMANLPQAVQQSANGRMLTGAQMANRLTQQGSNLQGVLAGQGNQANALQQGYQNAMGQANAQTGFQGQSQQLNLSALQGIASQYAAQANQANQLLQHFNKMRAQGLTLNVNEQAAQAQAAQAAAQAAQAQAALQQAATQRMDEEAKLAGINQQQQSLMGNKLQLPTLTANNGSEGVHYGILGSIGNALGF
jgi:chromosome segregation ATPase